METETTRDTVTLPQNRQMYVVGGIAFISCLVALFFAYNYFFNTASISNTPLPETVTQTEYDWASTVTKKPEVAQAQKLMSEKKYDEAVTVLRTLKEQTSNLGEQSVIDMNIAGALFQKNSALGAEHYAQIANNESYPNVTRGTAFLQVYLQYAGTNNKELIRPFFTAEEFTQYETDGTLVLETARHMYKLFPFVIASVVMGRAELQEIDPYFPEKEKAKPIQALNREAERIYEKSGGLFDSSIAFLERGEGMKQYIPNTYLTKANFLGDLALSGYVFTKFDLAEEARTTYEEALKRARAQGASITEQFILARYANYLLGMKMDTEAKTVVDALASAQLTPMFKGFLTTEKAKHDMSHFMVYIGKSDPLKTTFGL